MPISPTEAIDEIIPFRYLPKDLKSELVQRMSPTHHRRGETIIEQGDTSDRSVYLLVEGSVRILDLRGPGQVLISVIRPGHYFGELEPLFDIPRMYAVHAADSVRCYRVSGTAFLDIVHRSRAVAQSLGTILRDRQRIFAAFDRFRVELVRATEGGHIDLFRLLPFYRALDPALHPLVADENRIDIGALLYALRRLPENVSSTFAYLLADEIPAAYGHAGDVFTSVTSEARRRDIFEMLPGKSLVLLRNGRSDLTDFVSCLCLYAVEARKIRKRLQESRFLSRLGEAQRSGTDPKSLELPFDSDEMSALQGVWGGALTARLNEIVRHREMFNIDIRRQTRDYNSRSAERWTNQLGRATREVIGEDPSYLSDEIDVHIISSNTHSVSNCLNPWYTANKHAILKWAHATNHAAAAETWRYDHDLLYAVVRDYFRAHPKRLAESRETEREGGIHRIEQTVSTGVQVQLVDTQSVDVDSVDPGIDSEPGGRRALIVNIDYAFGEQAQHIMRNLLILYGRNVRSISFLGKAGALVGKRGDIVAPTAFVEQSTELFQPVPQPDREMVLHLKESLPDRSVIEGTMLTVDGTLLQNRMMLNFYRHLWGTVGIEMEGSHYIRQVVESRELGVIPEEAALRLYYYVSDLPLEHSASLSARLTPSEGVPPLYAITRCVLNRILSER